MPDDRLDPPMKPAPPGPLRLPRAGVPHADWRAPAPGSLEEALAAIRPMPEKLDDALSRLDAMLDRRFTFTPGPDAVFPPAWGEGDDAENPDRLPSRFIARDRLRAVLAQDRAPRGEWVPQFSNRKTVRTYLEADGRPTVRRVLVYRWRWL